MAGEPFYKLAIGAGKRENALEDKLVFRARFQAVFIQNSFHRARAATHLKNRLDRTTVAISANERVVGAFAQEEVQGADDDGLAGAGFSGDGSVARFQEQSQIGHQGQILNAQRAQHGRQAKF